jgi:hypothetical protein
VFAPPHQKIVELQLACSAPVILMNRIPPTQLLTMRMIQLSELHFVAKVTGRGAIYGAPTQQDVMNEHPHPGTLDYVANFQLHP